MKTEKYDFGTFKIGDHFIVGVMKEGADIQLDVVSKLIDIAHEQFNGEQWAYISNRVNSYSLQPLVHFELSKVEKNMIAFAVVTDKEIHIKNAELEKSFSGGQYEFECFANIENAIDWVTNLLKAG
jgi:hypothetical protein